MARFTSLLVHFVLLALCAHSVCAAAYPKPPKSTCKKPLIRKEWRTLSKRDRQAYISAVKCLQRLPAKGDATIVPGARTRYDDFHAMHILATIGLFDPADGGVHGNAKFLPWHRYLIAEYEKALRDECGYRGAQPYWNWTLDSGPGKDVRNSPVFDPVTGFGGNGPYVNDTGPPTFSKPYKPGGTGGGCVTDGPFKDMELHLGPGLPGTVYNPRCLSRNIRPSLANVYLTKSNIDPLFKPKTDTIEKFRIITEGVITPDGEFQDTFHGSGHFVVGGEADDFISSNAEPIFYLHHAMVDMLWFKWQSQDKGGKRWKEMWGLWSPTSIDPPPRNITLQDTFQLYATEETVTVEELMDPRKGNTGGYVCYEYEW